MTSRLPEELTLAGDHSEGIAFADPFITVTTREGTIKLLAVAVSGIDLVGEGALLSLGIYLPGMPPVRVYLKDREPESIAAAEQLRDAILAAAARIT